MTLPSVLVTDTNIWIDLENGKILADVFRLPYQFFTTDFAVEEFIHPRWAHLHDLGLQAYAIRRSFSNPSRAIPSLGLEMSSNL